MAHSHPARDHRPVSVHSGVILIPAALALFTALGVLLTIRTLGFAVIAGVGVFLVAFALTLLLHLFFDGDSRGR